jgi:hypothetical protein
MSSPSTQHQSRVLICPPAFPRARAPKPALSGPSPHRTNTSNPRVQMPKERRARKQGYRRRVASMDGQGRSRSPSWEPTTPSLLASLPVGNQAPVPTSSSLGPVDDASRAARSPSWPPTSPPLLAVSLYPTRPMNGSSRGARSPSWSPSSPPLLAVSPYSTGPVNDSSRAARSPSWSPASPPLLAISPSASCHSSAARENARSPSYSPAPPLLSTLFWRDASTNRMAMLTSPHSPGQVKMAPGRTPGRPHDPPSLLAPRHLSSSKPQPICFPRRHQDTLRLT